MVQSIVKSIVSVTSAVNEAQCMDFEEFDLEFQSGSRWITHALESCKRHIVASNGIEEESRKRRKAGSISDYHATDTNDKENNHPNIDDSADSKSRPINNEVETAAGEISSSDADGEQIDVMSLKVVELRKHLSERGLDTTGLKKALQQRLMEAIHEEKNFSADIDSNANNMMDVINENEVIVGDDMDENMEDVVEDGTENDKFDDMENEQHSEIKIMSENNSDTNNDIQSDDDIQMVEVNNMDHASSQNESTDIVESDKKASQKKTFGEKLMSPIRKVFSPSKSKMSPKKAKAASSSTIKECRVNQIAATDPKAEKSGESNDITSCNNEQVGSHQQQQKLKSNRASMVCSMTVDEIKSATMKTASHEQTGSKHVANVEATPSLSLKKAKTTTTSSQKLRSMKEARKARLDEIRNKVQSKTLSQLSSNKKQLKTTTHGIAQQNKTTDAVDRKRELAHQMRQKAAEAAKHHIQSEAKEVEAANRPAPCRNDQIQQQASMMKKHEKKPMSPMETYEMSDRGESDSDESDYDDRAPKKKIPKWAQRENLRPALERQFLDGPHKLDPDEIFPEVSTCDLEAIFDQKKKRYMKRTSSGNWTKDKVTACEKLVYKRNMGFCK